MKNNVKITFFVFYDMPLYIYSNNNVREH